MFENVENWNFTVAWFCSWAQWCDLQGQVSLIETSFALVLWYDTTDTLFVLQSSCLLFRMFFKNFARLWMTCTNRMLVFWIKLCYRLTIRTQNFCFVKKSTLDVDWQKWPMTAGTRIDRKQIQCHNKWQCYQLTIFKKMFTGLFKLEISSNFLTEGICIFFSCSMK